MTEPSSRFVVGEGYVVSPDVEKDGDEHPQLDPGDLVKMVDPVPDKDGEVYVTATASRDQAAIGAWVLPDYLMTKEEADAFIAEHSDLVERVYDGPQEDDEQRVVREFTYIPHPEYPNLPTYETLPLGYALGLIPWMMRAQAAQRH